MQGKLLYTDDTPVPGRASVTFHTEVNGVSYHAMGPVEPDGSFRLTTFAPDDGAVAGEHGISLAPIPGGEERAGKPTVPSQYATTAVSGLTFTVQSGTNNPVFRIEREEKPKK